MKTILVRWQPDRMESVMSALMGLAVVVAMGAFFSTLVRVSDRAPQIARAMERWQALAPAALVAVDATNAPSQTHRATGSTPAGPKVRPEVIGTSVPLRPGV